MLKFVLDDENLVFGYLDEIEVGLDEVVEAIYLRKYPSFTEVVHEKQFEQLMDHYSDVVYGELRSFVESRAEDVEEIEESSGCWGHYTFAIKDLVQEQADATEELEAIVLDDFISIDKLPAV